MADGLDKMRVDIEDLKERIRQHRIERGLPLEPPEKFVPVPLSIILAERVQPFISIAVKYASILADGTLYRVDTSKLDHYRRDAELLSMSKGLWCSLVGGGVRGAIRIMEQVNGILDAGEEENAHIPDLLRNIHFALAWSRQDIENDLWDTRCDLHPNEQERNNQSEIDRLKNDPGTFQAEYDAAMAQYKAIKSEI